MRLGLSRLARANSATSSIEYYSNTTRATRVLYRTVFDLKSNILLVYDLPSILGRDIAL